MNRAYLGGEISYLKTVYKKKATKEVYLSNFQTFIICFKNLLFTGF